MAIVVLSLAFVVGLPLLFAVRIQRREAQLRRGVRAEAEVVGSSQDGDTDYLRVAIGGTCACTVEVATTNVARHPLHSTIPVRYDPRHPDHAEALVDRPNPYEPVLPLAGGVVLGVAIVVPLVWVARRRRRRARALLTTTVPSMRVRVEAWQRRTGNTAVPYLSLYPERSPPGTPPLLCVPTDAKTVGQLHAGETLDLYGDPVPGQAVALRGIDVVVLPAGRARPGSWEAENRAPLSELVAAPPVGAAPGADRPEAPALFADAREARAWRRNSALMMWMLPLLVLLPTIRILPASLVVWTLPVLFALLIAEYSVLLRQRRLLDRIATRLPGASRKDRRARRVARSAASARLNSPAGLAETAALTGTTPDALAARRRMSLRATYGALGLVGVLVVVAVLAPDVLQRGFDRFRPSPPAIAGAPGYTTFTGPHGRPLPVGRPWGRACQPIRFTVEEHVPDEIYAQAAGVVDDARRAGLNVTMETRDFLWSPASLWYPDGETPDDVARVGIFADNAPPPLLRNGRQERVSLGWDAALDSDGRHERLTSAQGHLRLAAMSGDPYHQRKVVRLIVALTQGVGDSTLATSGLHSGSTVDGFSDADIAAMKLMSGCRTAPLPRPG